MYRLSITEKCGGGQLGKWNEWNGAKWWGQNNQDPKITWGIANKGQPWKSCSCFHCKRVVPPCCCENKSFPLSISSPFCFHSRRERGRDEGDSKHSHRTGWSSGWEFLLGALLPWTWHSTWWHHAQVTPFSHKCKYSKKMCELMSIYWWMWVYIYIRRLIYICVWIYNAYLL